jgi:hypothetical protein
VSRPDPSGADQIDAEHQAMDLMLGLHQYHCVVPEARVDYAFDTRPML